MCDYREPGLFNINLNICQYRYDHRSTDKQISLLEHYYDTEHAMLSNILTLWIDRIKYEVYPYLIENVLNDLKHLLDKKENEFHINLLAGYCNMCKQRHLQCNEENQRLQDLEKNKDKYKQTWTLAKLEKAYVLLFTDPSCGDEEAIRKLADTKKLLSGEYKHCSKKRKTHLNKALVDAHSSMCNVTESMRHLEESEKTDKFHTPTRLNETISMFNEGIDELKMYEGIDSCVIVIWQYYLAIALIKLLDCYKEENKTEYELGSCAKKSIDLFIVVRDSIHNDSIEKNSKLSLYKGRALAYIGFIMHNFGYTSQLKQYKHVRVMPSLEEAVDIRPYDAGILMRTCKVFLSVANSKKSTNMSRESYLQKAISFLDRAINTGTDSIYSAYRIRSLVYFEMACGQQDQPKEGYAEGMKDHLRKAIQDALHVFNHKRTSHDICNLAKCCKRLANLLKREFEKTNDENLHLEMSKYLKKGLYYLSYAVDLVGVRNYFVNILMGKFTFAMGERRKAVEYMKLAISSSSVSSNPKLKEAFLPYKYLLALYQEFKQSSEEDCLFLLAELQLVLGFGLKMKKQDRIKEIFIEMNKQFPNETDSFKTFIKKHPFESTKISQSYYEVFSEELRIASLSINDDVEEFSFSDLKLPKSEIENASIKFEYDFFMLHTTADRSWSRGILLPALETAMRDDRACEEVLKGCFEDRDFIPGNSWFDNTTRAIQKSRCTIIVWTKNFTNDKWSEYQSELSLVKAIEDGRKTILIKLDSYDLPLKFKPFVECDCTVETEVFQNIQKLKHELLQNKHDE